MMRSKADERGDAVVVTKNESLEGGWLRDVVAFRVCVGLRVKTVFGDEFRRHPHVPFLAEHPILFVGREEEYKQEIKAGRGSVELRLNAFIPNANAFPLTVIPPNAFPHDVFVFLDHEEPKWDRPYLLAYPLHVLQSEIVSYFEELAQINRDGIAKDVFALDFLFQLAHAGKIKQGSVDSAALNASLILRDLPVSDGIKEKLRKMEIYTIADLESFIMSNQMKAVPRLGVSFGEEELKVLSDALRWANRMMRAKIKKNRANG